MITFLSFPNLVNYYYVVRQSDGQKTLRIVRVTLYLITQRHIYLRFIGLFEMCNIVSYVNRLNIYVIVNAFGNDLFSRYVGALCGKLMCILYS
jgi:hypothetical protein